MTPDQLDREEAIRKANLALRGLSHDQLIGFLVALISFRDTVVDWYIEYPSPSMVEDIHWSPALFAIEHYENARRA